MLTELEVSSSTFIRPNNLNVRTDNVRPLAWMLFIFIFSAFGLALGITDLRRFQPPSSPIVNQFFLEEGTHRWILRTNEQCEGYVVGGWKKRKALGERIWFRFNVPAQGNLAKQSGVISAKFGDYKNLSSLKGSLNGKELSFIEGTWNGFASPPRELVLMVDAANGRRHLKLPSPWIREFESFLGGYINGQRKLEEVDKDQFNRCVGELQS